MYVQSLSRTFLICLVSLVLTACGGGGGGGDGGIIGGGGGGGGGGSASGSISLSIEFSAEDTDQVLAGNERATLVAQASEDGNSGELSVVFEADGGTLVDTSETTQGGTARVEIIGDGVGGTITATATITLSDGTSVQDTLTIQTSSDKPQLSLVVRNSNGVEVTQFDSNVELTAEATVVDFDGGRLEGDDVGQSVSFELGNFADIGSGSALTEYQACPVVGIKENNDCAFIEFTSSTTAGAGTITASVTINGIELTEMINVENTGTSGGIPDQDSFTITRIVDSTQAAEGDTVSLEGHLYNNQEATIRVDLADFQENPVPDGTEVNFRTELGDITEKCEISSGFCEATFVTGEPRSPTNTAVSFNNLDDNDCPSNLIQDEQVTISGGDGLTDYRVDEILRVRLNGTNTFLTEGVNFTATSNGIDCITCANGQSMQITYTRLWLDEENDNASTHFLLTPGVATEPYLDVTSTPCFAPDRENIEEISGSINPTASTSVTGVGTSFLTELAIGDRIKVGNEVRTVSSIASNTSLVVDSAFSDTGNDNSPERLAAPAYNGGMGQPYGARSTILAYALGEESFDDTNGNGEYDFGETFRDLPEPFLDKNEDGVRGDINGDSSTAGTLGPYRDAGLGTDLPTGSQAREKSNPYCYGPVTVVGDAGDGNDSTEASLYCYQDGGEEDGLVDTNGNGVMDVGNGIYNGSRCINPVQGGVTVCTTDLVNIFRETQVLLSGSFARTEFRATGSNGEGGTFGGGEIIQGIENRANIGFDETLATPDTWIPLNATTVGANFPGFPMGGAQVDTRPLDLGAGPADTDEEVAMFSITNPFSTSQANYTVSFGFGLGADGARTGAIDVFSDGELVLDDCSLNLCEFTVLGSQIGDLLFVVGDFGGNFRVVGTIHDLQISGVTTGTDGDFRSTENLESNDRSTSTLTQFNVGDEIDGTTVYPGVSEREAPSGSVPSVFTTLTSGTFWFTDQFNGQLPDGTTVKLESENTTGCQLTAVGGVAVTGSASEEFTVGSEVSFGLSYSVTIGGGGAGAIVATITTPIGNQTSDFITCNLFN